MPHYLVKVVYTPEAWAALLKNPHDRIAVVGKALTAVGARFVSTYMAFGDYDVVYIGAYTCDGCVELCNGLLAKAQASNL